MNPDPSFGMLVPLVLVLVTCVIALIAVNLTLLSRIKGMGLKPIGSTDTPAQSSTVPASSPAAEPIPAHHLAIITAVVSSLVRQPHILLDARALDTPPEWTQSMLHTWTVEGRSAIFSSHKVR
ncbi:MAG: hypothetical protein SFU85_06235 [Candidatus Methylacidiphilales bacterium]|nr:hypothetical protein [Candidatus Methylacidiphilales bacterium]